MLILLPLIVAVALGIAMHYGTPDPHSRGVVLVPGIAASTAAVVWGAMTWLGFAENNPWIWLASLVAPVVVAYPAALLIARARMAHDAAERIRLGIA